MVKIDPNKPLPNHTKLRCEECYAKILLEYFYPNKYCGLIVQDKPDLYDKCNNIGIEVVEAADKQRKVLEKLWYTMPYVSKTKQEINKKIMEDAGEPYNEGFQIWNRPIIYDKNIDSKPFEVLYNAIKQKLKKLNCGGYKKCEHYELFVCSELMIRNEWNDKMLKRMIDISSGENLQYEWVHISAQDSLCSYSIKDNKVMVFDIERRVQKMLANQARKIVEQGETNE